MWVGGGSALSPCRFANAAGCQESFASVTLLAEMQVDSVLCELVPPSARSKEVMTVLVIACHLDC